MGLAGFKAPARAHTEIWDAAGEKKIGEVTSGTFSPSLNKPIAMGYVATPFSKEGSKVRGRAPYRREERENEKCIHGIVGYKAGQAAKSRQSLRSVGPLDLWRGLS